MQFWMSDDHAYVPIYLVSQGKCPEAIASDIQQGPLEHAQQNVDSCHLGSRILVERCDGVPKHFREQFGDAQVTLVISGMGGLMIRSILEKAGSCIEGIDEFVLSPQRDDDIVRYCIGDLGYEIRDEVFLEEDGKFYPIIRATKRKEGENAEKLTYEEALWGPVLIENRDKVLARYLEKRLDVLGGILHDLAVGNSTDDRRAADIYHEITAVSRTLAAMENEVPARYACSWDHVGLLVGDRDAEVCRILVALDAGDEAVRLAEEKGCDLIVTHHPLLFHPMERVIEQDVIGCRVRRMIRSGISYFAMHTNFDIVKMADINARDLGLTEPRVLEKMGEDENGVFGFGRVGGLEAPLGLAAFAERVKKVCRLKAVRVYGDPEAVVRRAAVASGSGKSAIPDAIREGADVIVTGDVDYHTAIDSVAGGIAIIDAGHYGTEFCFIDYTVHMLKSMFPEIEVIGQEIRQPYTII